MKWFYIWSEIYADFHKYLEEAITDAKFECCPVYIAQEKFSKELYQHLPNSPWAGCNIKVLEILRILKEEVQENEGFLFTDVDIYLRPGSNIFDVMNLYDSFPEIDMIYSPEQDNIQIGSMFLRKNKNVIDFWENILKLCIENPNELDQTIINKELKIYPKNAWKIFPPEHVLNCHNIRQCHENCFLIYNFMVNNINQENDIEDKKLQFNYLIELLIHKNIISPDNRRYFILLKNGYYLSAELQNS